MRSKCHWSEQYKATIGICGNVLIIVLMAKKRLNSAVDILVINLAAADCLYCLGLPIWAYEMMKNSFNPEPVEPWPKSEI